MKADPAHAVGDGPLVSKLAGATMVLSGLAAVIGRWFVPSALWLDEALSVNISSLPIREIGPALRQDGHPPLYYVLLHGWMELFGTGDAAVRSLSAICSIMAIPLAWRLGTRLGGKWVGWLVGWLTAVSPYLYRYGGETRMYSLVVVLVFGLGLGLESARRSDSLTGPAVVALCTGALLWTHYWAIWLLASVGLVLVGDLVRRSRSHRPTRPNVMAIIAVFLGGLTFLPWIPAMLYQAARTGTPWADTARPTNIAVVALFDFNGGPYAEPQILGLLSVLTLVLGIFGRSTGEGRLELTFGPQPDAVAPATVLAVTFAVSGVAVTALGSGFQGRYASVMFPAYVVLLGLGLSRFETGRARTVAVSITAILALVGCAYTYRLERTQAPAVADAIRASASTDPLVAVCPDQLGPATARALGTGTEVVTYPRFASPLRVNWVDYAERNRTNDPVAFADELLDRAGDRDIFVVYTDGYKTFDNQCGTMVNRLGQSRSGQRLVTVQPEDYFEPMNLVRFPGVPDS